MGSRPFRQPAPTRACDWWEPSRTLPSPRDFLPQDTIHVVGWACGAGGQGPRSPLGQPSCVHQAPMGASSHPSAEARLTEPEGLDCV